MSISSSPLPSDSPSPSPIPLPLYTILRSLHLSYGLRHGDFNRYRSYCTRRLRRLRVSLNLRHRSNPKGEQKFEYHSLPEEDIVSQPHLLYILTLTERCWAHSQQLKSEIELHPDNSRIRIRAIGRMAKAVAHAKELNVAVEKKCDVLSHLQSLSYYLYLRGSLQFERERHADALADFHQCVNILNEICRGNVGGAELSGICEERIASMGDHIRVSEYMREKEAKEEKKDIPSKVGVSAQLSMRLESLRNERVAEAAKSFQTIRIDGVDIPIHNDKLRMIFVQIKESEGLLNEKLKEKKAEGESKETKVNDVEEEEDDETTSSMSLSSSKSLSSLYSQLSSQYDEASRVIAIDLPGTKLDQHKAYLTSLSSYVNESKLWIIFRRNKMMVREMERTIGQEEREKIITKGEKKKEKGKEKGVDKSSVKTPRDKVGKKKKRTKAEDVVVMYDKMLSNLSDLIESYSISKNATMAASTRIHQSFYSIVRCYWIGEAYRRIKRCGESLALERRADEDMGKLLDAKGDEVRKVIDVNEVDEAVKTIQRGRALTHAEAVRAMVDQSDSKDKKDEDSKKEKNDDDAPFFVMSNLDKVVVGESTNVHLFEYPIPTRPVPCKPILFDLAFNHIELPTKELVEAMEKAKGDLRLEDEKEEKKEKEKTKPIESQSQSQPPQPQQQSKGFLARLWGGK